MEQDNLLKRGGIYGKHPKLDKFVEAVQEAGERGIAAQQLMDKVGASKQTFTKIAVQAEALGKVDIEGAGKGGTMRLYATPNKQLLFTPGTTQKKIEDNVVEAIEELTNDEGVQNATYRISVQKIED